jgi:hypothetical protein
MTLELVKLTANLDSMSDTLAQLDHARHSQLQVAMERLKTFGGALDEIKAKVQLTRDKNLHWRGAYPASNEPLDTHYPRPDIPPSVTIIANDGSQVPIDRHASALYYALNTGYIIYAYGTEQPPQVGTEPSLHYHDDELFDANHRQRHSQRAPHHARDAKLGPPGRSVRAKRTARGHVERRATDVGTAGRYSSRAAGESSAIS